MKYRIRALCTAATAVSLTLLTGCLEQGVVLNKPPATVAGPGRFTGNPARLSRIELRVSQFTQLEQGQSAQLEVVAFDDQGNQIDPALLNLKWTAENGAALNVDAQGRVTGLQPVAISNVTVTDTNTNVSDTGQVAVTGPFTGDPAALDRLFFAFANQSLLNQGDSVPFVLIAVDNQGRPIDPAKLGQINWAVSDTSRFAIDSKGVVTALSSGQAATPAQVTATHAASGKVAQGSVDMLRGGNDSGSSSPSPSAPTATPGPSVSPTAQPSATPSATPTVTPTPEPTATPSASATPVPTPVPSSQLTGNPAQLASISISPSTRTLDDEGDKGSYFVIAVDTSGNYIDTSTLNFTWSTNKPSAFKVDGNGAEATVTALDNSGFADIIVTETGSGKTATAKVTMGSGGSGGGGGTTSTGPVLTYPVVDRFSQSYAGGSDGRMYAFDIDGDEIWSFKATGAITRNPAMISGSFGPGPGPADFPENSVLFFGTSRGNFYGLNVEEGEDNEPTLAGEWPVNVGAAITTAPMIFSNEAIVVFGDAEGVLHAYDFDGDFVWETDISDEALVSSPVVNNDGVILLGTQEGQLCMIDPDDGDSFCDDLTPSDESEDTGAITADPALLTAFGEEYVAIGNEDGHFYIVHIEDGMEVVLHEDLGAPITAAAVTSVNANDMVMVPAGGNLVGIDLDPVIDEARVGDFSTEAIPHNEFLDHELIWDADVCSGNARIIESPLTTWFINFPTALSFSSMSGGFHTQTAPDQGELFAYMTCSDGTVHQVDASDGEERSISLPTGSRGKVRTAPAFKTEDGDFDPDSLGQLILGGSDGKMHIVDLDANQLSFGFVFFPIGDTLQHRMNGYNTGSINFNFLIP